MTRQSQDVEFLIITPTYHRESLLVRFLKQVKSQTYGCWRLLVVHDGPNPLTEQLVGRFRAGPAYRIPQHPDPRKRFRGDSTARGAAPCGPNPSTGLCRLLGR